MYDQKWSPFSFKKSCLHTSDRLKETLNILQRLFHGNFKLSCVAGSVNNYIHCFKYFKKSFYLLGNLQYLKLIKIGVRSLKRKGY